MNNSDVTYQLIYLFFFTYIQNPNIFQFGISDLDINQNQVLTIYTLVELTH